MRKEKGGFNSVLILFNLYDPVGLLDESLSKDGTVIGQATLDRLIKKNTL